MRVKIYFCYPNPDQRFLKWIRIQPNDMDQTGSGSLVFQAIDYFWCPIKKIKKPIKKIKLMIIAFYQTHRKKIVEGESYEGVSIKKSNM